MINIGVTNLSIPTTTNTTLHIYDVSDVRSNLAGALKNNI